MKTFNVGVIGIGDISDVYIRNLQQYPIVHVLACAGRSLEKARQKAQQHGIARPYASAAELIADPDIDIILNLTLPAAHAEISLAALRAGKHVYTEKPLAATLAEGQSVLALARERGLMVASAPDTFLGARLQTCRKLIDDGAIGEVTAASAFVVSHGHEWFHPGPEFFYQAGGGPLLDIGPYYVTALLSLLGPVKRCSAMAKKTFATRTVESAPLRGKSFPVEVDTHITGNLEFASGAIGTLLASFDVWDSELPRMEIYGTKGTICLRDIDPIDGPNLFGGPVLLRTAKQYRWKSLPRPQSLPDWAEVPVQHPFAETSHRVNSRGIGLVDMAYAITQQRAARASGEMALHSLELMHGLLESATNGTFYKLHSSCERPQPLPVDFPRSESRGLSPGT
ncbi:MAG: Gfo/Idh/MocA family oxidoreductase [Burkholderiales bacterium]|nr:Gfo/Idh/MocA family oxidoreductase [Burkholderiales bacterium]